MINLGTHVLLEVFGDVNPNKDGDTPWDVDQLLCNARKLESVEL